MELMGPAATAEWVFVNDGSTDATAELARQHSFQMPVHLVQHAQNQGLGTTLRDGLREASALATERDVILTMDADNTHPPELLPMMLARQEQSGCDVVIASRFRRGAQVQGWDDLRTPCRPQSSPACGAAA